MEVEFSIIANDRRLGENAAYPLARPARQLALSLLLAGMSLALRRFVPSTCLNAPSGASNSGF